MSEIIDWDVAARVGVALLRPGPKLTAPERAAAVARLRIAAGRAAELVAEASRLPEAEAATHGTTLVVDRAGVVRANAASMAMVLSGLSDDEMSRLTATLQAAGAKLTGTGAGLVMAVIGTAILGQYEPFSDRLLLSAPTIEAVRAEIGASPDDFALWVCLHEQTHRHQFAAAPWMRDYMREMVRSAVSRDDNAPEGGGAAVDGLGLVGAMADDHLKAVISQMTALMSLLEGYADMLMDTSGAAVIPSLPSIRAQVDQRRRVKKYDIASLLRRAFGFDAKIDQYVVGKSFCETVSRKVGMDGLNIAFTRRDTIPTVDELRHPDSWLARCLPDALAA
ncbi:MAG: zinc-dependent metalloprotease [Propionibacteriaceae bacterium]|nr:zinc-dependent metalloprotease [Propionibacteriaceae bacterium]